MSTTNHHHLLWLACVFLVLAALACGPATVTVVVTAPPQPTAGEVAGVTPTAPPPPEHTPTAPPPPEHTATAPPPTVVPTPPPTTGPSIPAGWLLYVNPLFGYRFYYPPGATITEAGVEGYPTEELPAGKTPSEYMAELQAMYGNTLCVTVQYGSGYVSISAPANREFRYAICGRTGVGVGTMNERSDTLMIAGSTYTATGYEFMGEETPCDTLPCHNETMRLKLPDDTWIEYGAAPVEGVAYADYLATTRPVLVQIVTTFMPGP